MDQLHVATTKHQQEIKAAGELREQEYRIYLPKKHIQISTGRRVDVVSRLRFEGYIFIEFDWDKGEHGPVNNTRSIGRLISRVERVRFGSDVEEKEVAVPLPPFWELEMRRHEEVEWEIATGKAKPDPRADLHHGDIVKINCPTYAFHGQQGEYSRSENGEAIIHIGWAIHRIPEIDLDIVRKASAVAA